MIKQIKINDSQSVTVNTNAGWFYVYKSAFGHDILPDLLPALQGISQAVAVIYDEGEKTLTFGRLLEAIGNGDLFGALLPLSGLEITTILNVLWSCAYNADKTIPPVEEWIEDKDIKFDLVVPELFDAIPDALISSKNLKWLKGQMKKRTESLSHSTSSRSEQQPAD